MRRPQALLLTLREIIERTFDLDTGVGDLSRYIIGDRGLARIYGRDEFLQAVRSGLRDAPASRGRPGGPGGRDGSRGTGVANGATCPRPGRSLPQEAVSRSGARPAPAAPELRAAPGGRDGPEAATGHATARGRRLAAGSGRTASPAGAARDPVGARTLLRQEGGDIRVMLYYPDRLIRNLERNHPGRRLSEHNVDDFATLVEELDHFLTIADRHRAGAQLSLLELELHANVTKELVLRLFLARAAGRHRLGGRERFWIRHHLFHKVDYREEDPGVQARYRDAAALAVRYLDSLHALPAAERPRELRRFHRRTHHEKIEAIARL